jgi:hypothetical protein
MSSVRPATFWKGFPPALFAATLFAFVAAPAAATSYTIATLVDDATINGNCTLREALRAANGNVSVDACAAGTLDDSIVLPSGTYSFGGQEALSGAGSLSITSADLNPFHVTVNLQGVGRFLALAGGGSYVVGGLGITNGLAGGDGKGGAIRASDVTLRVFNFRFVTNAGGPLGGALYYEAFEDGAHRSLTMANGTFFDNHVANAASVPSVGGGAAYVVATGGNGADLRDVVFIGNSVSDTNSLALGGALTMVAGDAGTVVSCVRCRFQNNSAAETVSHAIGGAVYLWAYQNAAINLLDCRFVGNSASSDERKTAALGVDSALGAVVNLERLFVDSGGGVDDAGTQDVYLTAFSGSSISLVDSQLTFGAASGLEASADSATLRFGHLTIADYPRYGATISIFGTSQAVLQNSIIAFNDSGFDLNVLGTLSQTANFVGGNPLFLDELNGNYRLASSSPAINAGTSPLVTTRLADLDHRSRRAGLGTDIGSYEYNALWADDFEAGDLRAWAGAAP